MDFKTNNLLTPELGGPTSRQEAILLLKWLNAILYQLIELPN